MKTLEDKIEKLCRKHGVEWFFMYATPERPKTKWGGGSFHITPRHLIDGLSQLMRDQPVYVTIIKAALETHISHVAEKETQKKGTMEDRMNGFFKGIGISQWFCLFSEEEAGADTWAAIHIHPKNLIGALALAMLHNPGLCDMIKSALLMHESMGGDVKKE